MTIQWYPGHIAKAERNLKEQLKRVDVVLEVLDARIPFASHHPQVKEWIGEKPHLLILNRLDMIDQATRDLWLQWFKSQGEKLFFTNAKLGQGITAVGKATQKMGEQMNQRRVDRGMLPRPVRAVVIGMPNVGKSALINRLVGKKAVKSQRKAGVTRQLQWVRISDHIELLDAPGVIPWRLDNQEDAIKLAICEDIGEASYENYKIASAFVDLSVEYHFDRPLKSRYHLDPLEMTGEAFVYELGQIKYKGDVERASCQILNDFRTGVLGEIALELPPLQ